MSVPERLRPLELHPPSFSVTETPTLDMLTAVLSRTAPDQSVFEDATLTEHLALLTTLTARADRKLFVTDTPYGPWCIAAPKKIDIFLMKKHILAVARLQDTIIPERLRGKCGEVHAYAEYLGVADGVMSDVGLSQGKAVYESKSFHHIGYKTNFWTGMTLAFDLTSKAYVFAQGMDASLAPSEGIMVLENGYDTSTLTTLYGTKWNIWPHTPNPESDHYAVKDMVGILKE